MDAENQYRAIHEKFSAMLDGFKKCLAKKREGGVVPPNETILGTLPNKKSSPRLVILAISLVATGGGYFAWYSFDNHPLPNNAKHRMLSEDKLEKKLSVSSKKTRTKVLQLPKQKKL